MTADGIIAGATSSFGLLVFVNFREPQALDDTWDSPDIAMVCSRTSRY